MSANNHHQQQQKNKTQLFANNSSLADTQVQPVCCGSAKHPYFLPTPMSCLATKSWAL